MKVQRVTPSITPPERASPIPPSRAWNVDDAEKTRNDSQGILNLIGNATEREVKTNYRKISQIYHPGKHHLALTSMSPNQVEGYFKMVKYA